MGCPTGLVTAVAAVITSPGALLTPASKMALFGRIPRAGGVKGPVMLGTARDEGGTFVGLPGNLTEQGWQVHTLTAAPGVPLSNLTELCKLRNEPCPAVLCALDQGLPA